MTIHSAVRLFVLILHIMLARSLLHARFRRFTHHHCLLHSSSRLHLLRSDEEAILKQKLESMPDGKPFGFKVIRQYILPDSFDLEPVKEEVDRLSLSEQNVSLPVALQLVDPDTYPSLSRARKACRKGSILLHRGTPEGESFDLEKCARGRVADRCYPGDMIGYQVRMGSGYFPILHYQKPSFNISVVYEDDHFALVNKPAGVVVYNQKNGGHGTHTVRAALPFILQPPSNGTFAVLRRPASVHRLDKPTSGILCVAKTKPAMLELSKQFHDRIVKKTYMAIINGIPQEASERSITSREAFDMGVDVDPNDSSIWQVIDTPLEGQHSVTIWRAVRYVRSLHAYDGYLTLVEVKPKTGRYHQIRRHFAWETERPLVGDDGYDGNTPTAKKFRDNGLFLSSTRVLLEHPYYNGVQKGDEDAIQALASSFAEVEMSLGDDGKVNIAAEVKLPEKFDKLLRREEERYLKFSPMPQ